MCVASRRPATSFLTLKLSQSWLLRKEVERSFESGHNFWDNSTCGACILKRLTDDVAAGAQDDDVTMHLAVKLSSC